jgi:hypothetical protein
LKGDRQCQDTKDRMTPRFNFAPVSSSQSSLLRFASAYFLLNGVVYGVLLAVLLLNYLIRREPFVPTALSVSGILIGAMTAVGLVWTGSLMGRGIRLGGFLALGFLLLPVVFGAFSTQPLGRIEIVAAVLGVIVLSIIWRDLK